MPDAARLARFNKALAAFSLPPVDQLPAGADPASDALVDLVCAVAEGRGSNYGERMGIKG